MNVWWKRCEYQQSVKLISLSSYQRTFLASNSSSPLKIIKLHLNRGEDSWFWSSSLLLLLLLLLLLTELLTERYSRSILLLNRFPCFLLFFFVSTCANLFNQRTLQQNLTIASSSNFLSLFSNTRRRSDRTNKWPLRMTLTCDLDLSVLLYFEP